MRDEISIAEAAKLSGLCRQSIYNLVTDGKVRSRKLYWQHLIERQSLLEYIRQPRKRKKKLAGVSSPVTH